MVSHESTLDLNAPPQKTMMDQQCLDNFCYIWHALKLSTQLKKWYGSGCSFDIIIARWLLAVVCVCSVFFLCFLRAQCLMADSAGDKAHLDMVTAHTLHALYWMQKRARVVRHFHFGSSFKEKFVCVCMCACVCVCKLKRYVWNRVEDNCPFPLKSSSLILLKPATEIGFLHFQIICTPYVFHHTWIFLAIYCVSAYR